MFWCNSSTTRPHTWVLPVNTIRKSHNHTLSWHWYDYPQPRIIFSRLTQAKYHQITRQNSAYWQLNTSRLFSYNLLIQVPGCTVTRSADQHRPCFHTRKKSSPGQSSPATRLQFCSRLIHLTPKSLFPGQRLSGHLRKANNIVSFCLSRIRVIDPFSQTKREYNTILDDADCES